MAGANNGSAVDNLALQKRVHETIRDESLWNIGKKEAVIAFQLPPIPDSKASKDEIENAKALRIGLSELAYAVRSQLQKSVTGFTPRIDEDDDQIKLTTKTPYYKEAHKRANAAAVQR